MYFEDDHAGTFEFLATTLDLDRPHALVLFDAHSDASAPPRVAGLRRALRRVPSAEARQERIRAWRRDGTIQAYDWIAPLAPRPLSQVVWVRIGPPPTSAGPPPALPARFTRAELADVRARLKPGLPVVASVDLDMFAGMDPSEQSARFAEVWGEIVRLPRLAAITFALSRTWLSSDDEASRLLLLALRASLALAHATLRFEIYGIEGRDDSERAKAFYRERRAPPRLDPDALSPELRSLLLANAERLDVRLDPARWAELLSRWRAEAGAWRVVLPGVDPGADGVWRPAPDVAPELRVEGGAPGHVRRVTWLRWMPAAPAYDVLPELPAGKVFAAAAPPVIQYEASALAAGDSLALPPEVWVGALPGPDRTGVLRVSAEVETDDGLFHTARVEVRRGGGTGFRAALAEQFGLPYVFGAGFLRAGGLSGPDTRVGNDCANLLAYAWRRAGLRIPWVNPAQLRRHLVLVAEGARPSDRVAIPADAGVRGLVVHLGTHVAALWEDRPPLGSLGPEDVVVHHLGGPPELLTLDQLLRGRERPTFDLYLGPARAPVAWIALGGDVVPPEDGPPPEGLTERLRRADAAIVNLEAASGELGDPVRKRYVFRVPASRLEELRSAGLSAVSLANNHAGDFGAAGLAGTLSALDASGLGRFGAGRDAGEAIAPWIADVKGIAVAFLGVSVGDGDVLPAGSASPGVAVLPAHEVEVAAALAAARARARTVVVVPHWGMEGSARVTDEQRRWARWLVEHGADAVIGSGPHVLQAVDAYEGAPVFYSLGNLWFGGRWPANSRAGGLAWLGLDAAGRIVEARLEPFGQP